MTQRNGRHGGSGRMRRQQDSGGSIVCFMGGVGGEERPCSAWAILIRRPMLWSTLQPSPTCTKRALEMHLGMRGSESGCPSRSIVFVYLARR